MSGTPDRRPAAPPGTCLGCRLCQAACPAGLEVIFRGRPEAGPGCLRCAACLEVCPAGVFPLLKPGRGAHSPGGPRRP